MGSRVHINASDLLILYCVHYTYKKNIILIKNTLIKYYFLLNQNVLISISNTYLEPIKKY